MATLGSGKVYVGYVTRNLNAEVERRYLRMLPIVSGYRTRDTLRVVFTTLYEQIRDEALDPASPFHSLLDKDFELVVPLAEIKTVSLFDFDAYEAFNREEAAPEAG